MNTNQVRIIAGKYRSRKIDFPAVEDLRPTPDRVRETLFNWLAPYLLNALCLDLFAGSGVLGFEALSRGAGEVVLVEKNPTVIASLKKNVERLQAENSVIINQDAMQWLTNPVRSFDIVFLDPPYQAELLFSVFSLLETKKWLNANAFIYFESDIPILPEQLPSTWEIWREKKAGRIYYYLAQKHPSKNAE